MSGKQVLVTGGAGFIGSYLVPELYARGYSVAIVDNLIPGATGEPRTFSESMRGMAVCVHGDVRNAALWQQLASAFPETETLIHLAAWAGTGQSASDVRECESVNAGGLAAMLGTATDRLHPETTFHNLQHVVLASSCAVYGEGAYECPTCRKGFLFPAVRSQDQLSGRAWDHLCSACSSTLRPLPVPEGAPKSPATVYGATKLAQEFYARTLLSSTAVGLTILRLQNVFGPGQRAANPYSGCLERMCASILAGRPVELAEDGGQTRDFVYVTDAAASCVAATEKQVPGTFNVGSGLFTPLAEAAQWLNGSLDGESDIVASGAYRVGDARHGAADMRNAHAALGFSPAVTFQQGLQRYSESVRFRHHPRSEDVDEGRDTSTQRQAA